MSKLVKLRPHSEPRLVSECLESAGTPAGQQRVAAVLEAGPFPHYKPHPHLSGLLVRIEENGNKTSADLSGEHFSPLKPQTDQERAIDPRLHSCVRFHLSVEGSGGSHHWERMPNYWGFLIPSPKELPVPGVAASPLSAHEASAAFTSSPFFSQRSLDS